MCATSEERKRRNRLAQAAFWERRTEYIKELEATIKHHEDIIEKLQPGQAVEDEGYTLKYRKSLLENLVHDNSANSRRLSPLEVSLDLQFNGNLRRDPITWLRAKIYNDMREKSPYEPTSHSFPAPENGIGAYLLEDFAMRGQIWSQQYHPERFFNDCPVDDEERSLEMPSMAALGAERCLYLGIRLASVRLLEFRKMISLTVLCSSIAGDLQPVTRFAPLPDTESQCYQLARCYCSTLPFPLPLHHLWVIIRQERMKDQTPLSPR
jgi:hypothetical protein